MNPRRRAPSRRRWRGDVLSVEDARNYLDYVHDPTVTQVLVEAGASALKMAVAARVVGGTVALLRAFVVSAETLESPAGLPPSAALRAVTPGLAELADMIDAARFATKAIRAIGATLTRYESEPFGAMVADLADPSVQLAAQVVLAARRVGVLVTGADLAAVAFVVDRTERLGTHQTRANTWKKRLKRAGPVIDWLKFQSITVDGALGDLSTVTPPRLPSRRKS